MLLRSRTGRPCGRTNAERLRVFRS